MAASCPARLAWYASPAASAADRRTGTEPPLVVSGRTITPGRPVQPEVNVDSLAAPESWSGSRLGLFNPPADASSDPCTECVLTSPAAAPGRFAGAHRQRGREWRWPRTSLRLTSM